MALLRPVRILAVVTLVALAATMLIFDGCGLFLPPIRVTPETYATPTSTRTHTPGPTSPIPSATPFVPPTSEPGGQVLTLAPRQSDVGWWASGEAGSRHVGDSYLYAGYYEGQAFISAACFDLSRVAPETPIQAVTLRMTGLSDERLIPSAAGAWSMQLLAMDVAVDLSQIDFQQLLNAPAAITLLPILNPTTMGVREVNSWSLGPAARAWLQRELSAGNTRLALRITGPAGSPDTLFAWDSGFGSSTMGAGPELVLTLGQARYHTTPVVLVATATPENIATAAARLMTATAEAQEYGTATPLPYNARIVTPTAHPPVITFTPTPANEATAEALAAYATAVALTTGTFTPVPPNAVTPIFVQPTPEPLNVATAVAQARTATAEAELYGTATPLPFNAVVAEATATPPVITMTPTPANEATATANAEYATAVALTTGTFTPVPANAVTPIIIQPTPMPENVVTAAAQMALATAEAEAHGTPTPLPFNAVIATVTPGPVVITMTPLPANQATAIAHAVYATAVARTTGTFTPMPPNAMTPTPMPLILYLDEMEPTVQPTPTPTIPGDVPSNLVGRILFMSDREGDRMAIFALDLTNGRLAQVTQLWPYQMASSKESRSPDGRFELLVQNRVPDGGDSPVPQVFIRDNLYETVNLLHGGSGLSYDPVWSPTNDRVAFVCSESGNDEIYTASPNGENVVRLTTNNWEWDKHPSWSPDGSQIVFWSNRETGRRQLWIMNADGTNQRRLLDSPFNDWDPIWVK